MSTCLSLQMLKLNGEQMAVVAFEDIATTFYNHYPDEFHILNQPLGK